MNHCENYIPMKCDWCEQYTTSRKFIKKFGRSIIPRTFCSRGCMDNYDEATDITGSLNITKKEFLARPRFE